MSPKKVSYSFLSFKMIKRVTSLIFCAFLALSINQIEGKLKTPEFSPKSYASSGNQAVSSYSTIPVDSVNKNIDSPNAVIDFAASGNIEQGRTNGVSYSPYQSVESSNTVPSYASYQNQPSIQSPYFYGTPPHYYIKQGKNEGFLISRQAFPSGAGDLGGTGSDGGGGDLGGLAGLLGLLGGLKGLKGLKGLVAPLLPLLFFPLLLPLLPILLLGALLPLILLIALVPLPVITTGRRALQDESLADGVSFRLLHISKVLPKLATDVWNSDECVERISCEISRMSKTYKLTSILNKMTNQLPTEGVISKRIAKGMAQDDYSSIVKPTRGSKKVTNEDTEGCEIFICKPKPLIVKHLLSTD